MINRKIIEDERKAIIIMRFGLSYTGLIWLIMLFVPNYIWTRNKPQDYEKYAARENRVLLALERIGQFIVTPVRSFFLILTIKDGTSGL